MNYISSKDFVGNLPLARAYLRRRAADAVKAFRNPHDGRTFLSPIDLAQYIARYW